MCPGLVGTGMNSMIGTLVGSASTIVNGVVVEVSADGAGGLPLPPPSRRSSRRWPTSPWPRSPERRDWLSSFRRRCVLGVCLLDEES